MWALPGLLAGLLSLALASFVWRMDAGRVQNQRMALLLMVTGGAITAAQGIRLLMSTPAGAFGAAHLSLLLATMVPLLLVRFVATLDGPLTSALGARSTSWVLGLATAAAFVAMLVVPEWAIRGLVGLEPLAGWHAVAGPMGQWVAPVIAVSAAAAGFAASKGARIAPDEAARAQANAYAFALGLYAGLTGAHWALVTASTSSWATSTVPGNAWSVFTPILAQFLLAGLLVRGTLQSQLLKTTARARGFVSQSAILATFTFVFVVGGELLERLIPAPGLVLGIAAAVLLALALRPMQRLADRLAQKLVPDETGGTDATPFGADEVYRSAFVGAFGDGELNAKEEKTLETLRRQLGVSSSTAKRIEQEALRELNARRETP